jgi:heme exporter protein A
MAVPQENLDSKQPAIAARGLARRFGGRWALRGVDLEVPVGGALLITGANGSGKTTLIRCLSTALRPHHGTLELFGRPAQEDRASHRRRIAMLSHATGLYDDLSAHENVRVWATLQGLRVDVDAALARTGLSADRPEPVRTFSAGMRRRLALAILLLKTPELLLLDEPFAALDAEGRRFMSGLLGTLRSQGVTLVIASHLPVLAGPHCDEAVHLDAGLIAWTGLTSALPAAATSIEGAL